MASKIYTDPQNFGSIKFFIHFLAIFILLPQSSTQQVIIEKLSVTEGLCVYNYDQQGLYSCNLHNAAIINPTDVLNIVGTHLPGYTDANVLAVYHRNVTLLHFNGEILRKFTNLRLIEMSGFRIKSMHANAFEICGQLEEVNFGWNELTALPSQLFRNCVNLRRVSATASFQLVSIPGDLFGNTRNLEIYEIGGWRLESIPSNLLQNMANLRVFNIQSSRIHTLSPNLLMVTRNLEEINLSLNNFNDSQVVMNLMNGHMGLRRIFLNSNELTTFDFGFFTQFQRLEELAIGERLNMTGITWRFLPGSLTTLRVLQIGEEIPENAFFGLPNLRVLEISGRGITNLHQNTFRECPRLEVLSITATSLTTLNSQLFAAQSNVRHLDLSWNQIEHLPDGVFAPLVNLGFRPNETINSRLYLSSNRIRSLTPSIFGQHQLLREIFFNSNEIIEIQRGFFSRFHPSIVFANFIGNMCINTTFWLENNLDQHPGLQTCFDNFEGITTTSTEATTPDGCGTNFKKFEIFLIIFAGLIVVVKSLLA